MSVAIVRGVKEELGAKTPGDEIVRRRPRTFAGEPGKKQGIGVYATTRTGARGPNGHGIGRKAGVRGVQRATDSTFRLSVSLDWDPVKRPTTTPFLNTRKAGSEEMP